jgi:DNA-binding response OmpR family regulator
MRRILIVDHDETTRSLLRGRLSDDYEVHDTANAEHALGIALEHKPDAILLDLSMPKFSGIELCQTLRSISYTSRIPVFAMTEKNGSKPPSSLQDLGVAAWFEKPVDMEEIKHRLAHQLQNPRPQQRAHVRIKMRTILKLKGTDAGGNHFEELTATENVSVGGFLCNSTTVLADGALVEVFLATGEERYAGRARLAHKEDFVGPWQRYGFQFEVKTKDWVLQDHALQE